MAKNRKRLQKEKPPFWQDQQAIINICVGFLIGREAARCMEDGDSPAKKDKALRRAAETGELLGKILYQEGLGETTISL